MKTTKKGFTLIELIVVIAIIGVLAAILVPTMLGYVKKSKISSANTTASSVYKAINTALVEMDEEGNTVGSGTISFASGGTASADSILGDSTAQSAFNSKMQTYFADIVKLKDGQASIEGGTCIAVACTTDSTYYGTVPTGIVTTDNYDSSDFKDISKLLEKAIAKAKNTSSSQASN